MSFPNPSPRSWSAALFGSARRVLRASFGELSWQPPAWALALARAPQTHPGRSLAAAVLLPIALSGIWAGVHWSRTRPKPELVEARVLDPGVTPWTKDATLIPRNLAISFSKPVARLEDVNRPISSGIRLDPPMPGRWDWSGDSLLVFTPAQDWPADTRYRILLKHTLFTPKVKLARYDLEAETPAFNASVDAIEFYQDPSAEGVKQITATIRLTHRTDLAELTNRVELEVIGESPTLKALAIGRKFSLTAGEHQRIYYFRTEAIALPEREDFLRVNVREGLRTLQGGAITKEAATAKVRVPDRYSFFRIAGVETFIARKASGEPEQMLLVRTTAAARPEEIAKALQVWLLPARNPRVERPEPESSDATDDSEEESEGKRGEADDNEDAETSARGERDREAEAPEPILFDEWAVGEVDEAALKDAKPVACTVVPTDKPAGEAHTFRLVVPTEGRLYIRLPKGLKAPGDYELGAEYTVVAKVPVPAIELEIQGEGGVLALGGERKLSLKTRGVALIEHRLAQVPADQINHLVSQTSGAFSAPEFRGDFFNEENLARIVTETQPIALRNRFEANYAAFDFSKHLRTPEGGARFRQGLFLLRSRAIDPRTKKPIESAAESRFVLVTDLGLIAKANADGTREVFVASLQSGQPAGGVTVEIIAKNGVPLASILTGPDGRASLPAVSKLTREQTPVAFVARRGDDVAFLPYRARDRGLDFSRFDVGGVEARSGAELDAFVFTERGVYRPGDSVRIASIVHQRDWRGSLEGVPLELEVIDATGHESRVTKFALPASGMAEATLETTVESPTGPYTLRLHLLQDGKRKTVLGTASFNVKEFLPDTMKIAVKLSQPAVRGWLTPEDLKAAVTLQNLYGTPATDRRLEAKLEISPRGFAFADYKDWTFYDPLREGKKEESPETVQLGKQKTDDAGESTFTLDLWRFADATYSVQFQVDGFEAESGRSVSTSTSTLISPLDHVVGWKPDGSLHAIKAGADRSVRFLALDRELQPVALDGLTLERVEEAQIAVLSRQDNGSYRYTSVKREKPLGTSGASVPAAGINVPLVCAEPGTFEIRLIDAAGRRLARVRYSVIGEGANARVQDKNAELQIKLPRKEFKAGEIVEIGITAPYTGCGLITLERDRVYAHAWFKADQPSSIQKLRIPADFDGTGYVNVSFVRALDSREIYASPLSYAVAPITVNREGRRLSLEVRTAAEVKPGEPLKIRFKADRPARIVVYAVDKGIHQVSDYKLPDPLEHFFRRAALMVTTSQIVDQLLPEFSLLRSTSATGGDGDDGPPKTLNPFRRVTEEPVVFWSGVIEAGPAEQEVTYQVPDYFNGTLAVMAVSCAPDAVGSAETKALVRGSFIITPSIPTMAAPGDEFEAGVTVANNVEGSGDNALVRLAIEPSAQLELVSPASLELRVSEGRETSTTVRVKVREALGSADLTFRATATTGEQSLAKRTLSVRPATAYAVELRGGNFTDPSVDVPVQRDLYPEFRKLEATVSALPLGLARGLETYLHEYPNGCTEQLVSGAFARIALADEADIGLSRAEALAQATKVYAMLRARQNDQGGFGYWNNEGGTGIDFVSVYAAHFLIEAKALGFAPPADLLQKALGRLQKMAGTSPSSLREGRTLAYAIHLLTREGVVTTNYLLNLTDWLNRSAFAKTWKNDLCGAHVAATLSFLQKTEEAERLIGEYLPGKLERTEWWDFHTPLGADAQYTAILAARFPKRLRAWKAADLQTLLRPISTGAYNTLSAAYAVLALKGYSRLVQANPPGLAISEIGATKQAKALVTTGSALLRRGAFSPEGKAIRFEMKTAGATGAVGAFQQVIEAGYDRRPPVGIVADGLEVVREILLPDGTPRTTAKVGESIRIVLKIRSKTGGSISNVAVLDLLPGGFEIADRSVEPGSGRFGMDYVDVREDRVILFGTIGPTTRTISYSIKATARGEFTVPPPAAESMYDRAIHARGVASRIKVVAP